MRLRLVGIGVVVTTLAALAWRSQLAPVERRPHPPEPLVLESLARREAMDFDAVLPVVPVGERRVRPLGWPLLVHYWAPWERNGRAQIRLLDSLVRTGGLEGVDVVVVCSDPYPSVARFVARQRVRVTVVLDGRGDLKSQLPCPNVPYTWLFDRHGRVAARLAGEVDWFAAGTRQALETLIAEPALPGDAGGAQPGAAISRREARHAVAAPGDPRPGSTTPTG